MIGHGPSCQEDAFAEQMEAGQAEHLASEHLDPVDVTFNDAGVLGRRIHAVEQVALNRHGLDLPFAWPRLWLLLPDTSRNEITAAHAAPAAAVATGTWSWPYLLLGCWWWPAALIGLGIGLTGWVRARAAVTDLSALSEAALDLHGRALAIGLGVAPAESAGPLTQDEGQ